ncbi:MAG: sigma-54-dependent Fis family transcriptional regulator [Desulfobulbaceae bacterium]|nr:sigma-54-dependent Fis family transcriptional regulator [Desulfobulbaceae bacterium]
MSKNANVLVIDDEPSILNGCRMSLSENGYEVTCQPSGQAGLEEALNGKFDVVLLDMKLPDLNGMDILAELHTHTPGVPIVFMTGYSTVQNAVKAMKSGAFDYLAKPFSDDELLFAIDKALENKELKEENQCLRKQLFERFDFSNIVGENNKILEIFDTIKKVAPITSTVLLTGNSGTGKELFAGAIHAHSLRSARQMVTLDCSTLSPSLLESELFGHVKGAFTGATQNKQGIFGTANRGTLFLDEVSNLDMEIQGKLLRVMEYGEYKPVGASKAKKCDVRVIAATNKDLSSMVTEGTFREDLFYRLNVFPIRLPSLSERKDDIPKLAYHFLRFFCRKIGKHLEGFSDDALATLMNHPWPGNIRQLKNTIERLVILADKGYLDSNSLQGLESDARSKVNKAPETVAELKAVKKELLDSYFGNIEKTFLKKALTDCNGNITKAAQQVGMQRSNFSLLMKKHNMSVKSIPPSK